ncbi:hypothetical protein FXW78_39625 [Rhodococcus opacus]|nr:hypothetical protein [Rhodococcus opacus]
MSAGGAVRAPGSAYYEGQLGYIGEHYDLSVNGVPWRMLFVGMELGGTDMFGTPRLVDRRRRSRHHDLALPPDSPTRNKHMNGVILALRYALGLRIGIDPKREFVPIVNADRPAHVLLCYALINARLCSATPQPGVRRSAGVPRMTSNCFSHLEAAVRILQPTLVVIQGKGLWPEIEAALRDPKRADPRLPLKHATIGGVETMVAHFSHPTAQDFSWAEPNHRYLQEEVVPTLRTAVRIARY